MLSSHTPPDIKIVPIAKRPVAPSKEQLPSPTSTGVSKKVSYRNPSRTSTGLADGAAKLKYKPGKWDIWMLGITIVIGGQYISWNAGIAAGLYTYLICYFVIASAYVTLCCCTSEITGGLPFAGGAYGLARCTLGFLPAFLIGCCEALEYIVYVSTSVISLADVIVEVSPSLRSAKPLIWALFYISALYVHIKGDRVFWIFNLVIGSTSILIVVIFVFGSLPFVDYTAYAHQPSLNLVDGFAGLLKVLPLACWFFVGVEALNLASDQVTQPKQCIPYAQTRCVVTLFVTGIMVFFVTVSLPPGLASLPTELVPLNNGFEPLFNMSHTNATILSLPATLLPVFLSRATTTSGTPYMAITFGSALSYIICLVVYFVPTVSKYLFNVCITAAFMSYTGQCVGYISLKMNYRNIKSSYFHSPFGILGALYSMSVWILCIVSIIGFQGNGGQEIMIFGIVIACLTVYYYAWARKRQTFSPQENRIMLVAHVMKFNGRRAAGAGQKRKRGSKNNSGKTTNNNSRFTNAESTHMVGSSSTVGVSKVTTFFARRTGRSTNN
ncbi:hypothetical protein Poli38472_011769 [Pythium oligandrum]|uniref:Amino acid permease/ SLC12A domain-containing protein n=1 Tax=Pythium oligandrum TaxID=41045 RepID=A0A8K1C866_PYTOL|nr:hypothetical protein Poli38472_011769 [Pythium oligandrum]|eukprot:TMW58181.1 hypothetical protein Poli38472_011769 [Pythium oligandrum]